MKIRHALILTLGLITTITLIVVVFYSFIQSKLPNSWSKPIILIAGITLGVATFLAALKDIIELVEKLTGFSSHNRNNYDVYISYSQSDLPFVKLIDEKIRRKGIKTWFFENQAPPGAKMDEVIQKAILDSKSAVFFIGTRGLTAWQQKELDWADNAMVHTIPALVPNINFSILQTIPQLSNRLAVRFKITDDKDALNRLIRGIREHN